MQPGPWRLQAISKPYLDRQKPCRIARITQRQHTKRRKIKHLRIDLPIVLPSRDLDRSNLASELPSSPTHEPRARSRPRRPSWLPRRTGLVAAPSWPSHTPSKQIVAAPCHYRTRSWSTTTSKSSSGGARSPSTCSKKCMSLATWNYLPNILELNCITRGPRAACSRPPRPPPCTYSLYPESCADELASTTCSTSARRCRRSPRHPRSGATCSC